MQEGSETGRSVGTSPVRPSTLRLLGAVSGSLAQRRLGAERRRRWHGGARTGAALSGGQVVGVGLEEAFASPLVLKVSDKGSEA